MKIEVFACFIHGTIWFFYSFQQKEHKLEWGSQEIEPLDLTLQINTLVTLFYTQMIGPWPMEHHGPSHDGWNHGKTHNGPRISEWDDRKDHGKPHINISMLNIS